jgi:hypothetical protein
LDVSQKWCSKKPHVATFFGLLHGEEEGKLFFQGTRDNYVTQIEREKKD